LEANVHSNVNLGETTLSSSQVNVGEDTLTSPLIGVQSPIAAATGADAIMELLEGEIAILASQEIVVTPSFLKNKTRLIICVPRKSTHISK
jgi:hypothetical protein